MSRKWYDQVKEFMLSVGCKISLVDPAVFYYYQDGSLQGIIAVHVDDFFWAGLVIFKCNVISKLRSRFKVGNETSSAFKYLGLGVSQNENNSVTLSQEEYIGGLKQAEVRGEDKKELLSVTESDSL